MRMEECYENTYVEMFVGFALLNVSLLLPSSLSSSSLLSSGCATCLSSLTLFPAPITPPLCVASDVTVRRSFAPDFA